MAAPQELWLSRTASTAPIRTSLSVGRVKVLKVNKYPDPSLLTFLLAEFQWNSEGPELGDRVHKLQPPGYRVQQRRIEMDLR